MARNKPRANASTRSQRSADGKPAPRPCWDAERRELRVGDVVVKRFRQPAVNQILILTVFEEDGWPARIDDPLPPDLQLEAKDRLHDAIKRLNRGQLVPLIRFRGDGTGTGLQWEFADGASSSDAIAPPERP